MRTLAAAKKGELFYIKYPDLDVFKVLDVKEGFEEEGYVDVNANTIYIKSLFTDEESKVDSRSVFAMKYNILDNDEKKKLVKYVFAYLDI